MITTKFNLHEESNKKKIKMNQKSTTWDGNGKVNLVNILFKDGFK